MRSIRLGFILAAAVSSVACGGGTADGTSSGTSGATTSGGTSSGGTTSGGTSGATTSSGSVSSSGVLLSPGFTAVTERTPIEHFKGIAAQGFDGAVIRQAYTRNEAPPACSSATPDNRNFQEAVIGEPCKGAADAAACANELACLYSPTGFVREGGYQIASHHYFVFGSGGKLDLVSTRPDLLARLGKIDSAAKAMLLASLEAKFRAYVVGYRATADGGWDLQMEGGGACSGSPKFDLLLHVALDGTVTEVEKIVSTEPEGGCAEGRRPLGLLECPRGGLERGIADYLAEAAHLEAAAVVAFEQMVDTLRAFGAPDPLVQRAEAAKRDEIRHARTMSKLARDFGGEPRPVRVEPTGAIDLEALAIDNAIEGCIRETYAVARALWQSKHAADPRIRATFSIIARDETRHAELSWALSEYLETKLDAATRARVEAARHRALVELRHELHAEPHPEVVRLAGMPDVDAAVRLFDELFGRLELAVAA